jgi:hypothetical protein
MNNKTTDDTLQEEIWMVQGKNWTTSVKLNAYNRQFSSLRQSEEAGTQAIEAFKGQENGLVLKIEDGSEQLELGGVILVYPLNSNPDDGFLIMAHELLANAAYYKDSYEIEQLTRKFLGESIQAEQEIINAEIKNLEAKDIKPLKKPRKKPSPEPDKPAKKPRKKKP